MISNIIFRIANFSFDAEVELRRPAETFGFLRDTWGVAITIALGCGWEPERERSIYPAADGLEVSAADAAAMADAVEAWVNEQVAGAEGGEELAAVEEELAPWRRYVQFCRGGGFTVATVGPDGGGRGE